MQLKQATKYHFYAPETERSRQKGSHLILFHPEKNKHVTVPVGKQNLPNGTAKAIFRSAGIESR